MKSPSKSTASLSTRKSPRQALGRWGEQTAAEYAAGLGYEVVARNARTPYGELDLVLRRGDEVVIAEVKTRASASLGAPEISVTPRKQTHLLQSAQHFMDTRSDLGSDWRVDVIAITLDPAGGRPEITWFEDAVHGE